MIYSMSASLAIKKCQKTYCKKMVKNSGILSRRIGMDLFASIKQKIKELENKSNKTKEEWEVLKRQKEYLRNVTKSLARQKNKTEKKKRQKREMQECTETHCNPGCKGTIFESKKIPEILTKKYRKYPKHLAFLQKQNDTVIFQNKKTVLENDFYEKYTPKQIKEIQKEGAISGCSLEGARYFYKNP